MKNFKRIICYLLVFQIFLGWNSYSYDDGPSYDFSDEPFVVTSGDDRSDGRDDGNCVGSGCDDREGSNRGEYDDEESGTEFDQDDSQFDGPRRDGDERDSRGSSGLTESVLRERTIAIQDTDRGDGVFILRDSWGEIYYRGEPAATEQDRDLTDIYTNSKDVDFVKSKDGKRLLPINGLRECAPALECDVYGYKDDWWNNSILPQFRSSKEYFEYRKTVNFAEKQLTIKSVLEKAKQKFSQQPVKMKVVDIVDTLYVGANSEFRHQYVEEALALQEGAIALLSTIVDVGLSVSPVAWGKDAYEFITGISLVTGKNLSEADRIIAGIGVVLPGVGVFAAAGIRIVRRMSVRKSYLQNAQHVQDALAVLGNLKTVRFKEGKNLSEVAVIGRDMESVREAGARLNSAGIKTRIFEASQGARNSLKRDVIKNGNSPLSYDKIPATEIYNENMSWARRLLDDNISVLDVGNPKGLEVPSRFYDDEVLTIFKEVNKL